VAWFLAALVVLLVITPFAEDLEHGDLLEALLMTVVFACAVPATAASRRTLVLAAVLGALVLLCRWGHYWRPQWVPAETFLVTGLLFVAFIIAQLIRWVLRAPRVDAQVLCAGVAGYLMLAILWALAYLLLLQLQPNSLVFSAAAQTTRPLDGFDALYFSFGTITTLDYGDIIPISRPVSNLAMAEVTTGVFYKTILIARLVALYSSGSVRPAKRMRGLLKGIDTQVEREEDRV
jgi:hypothetical protein